MTKIVIAPDKFKGSLSGIEFCNIVEYVLQKKCKHIDIKKLPLADGGDGTVEVLNYYLKGDIKEVEVAGPLHHKVLASYYYSNEKNVAFIEMAEASGLKLLNINDFNPLMTSTFGTGELILDAINQGAKHIILGIGGSATNDAGIGMAKALGFRFLDSNGMDLKGTGEDLIKISSIDSSNINSKLKEVKFDIACDVNNPLFGPNGAAYIYAPQKGADLKTVKELDQGLQNFNHIAITQFNKDLQSIPGAGAAGGLGAGCILFLNATLKSGIDLIKDIAQFNKHIINADWIITGEGKLDNQTLSGKVISGIFKSLTKQKVAIFCGINALSSNYISDKKIDYVSDISTLAKNTSDSIANASKYLKIITKAFY
ncbi:glycerate kinase [Plebeiibacterium sediminum]|uniref:Glycerate kinase n=1 Tax=Plebeiibacterium sediminum TaxID=2992112 RepID=A0AAE3M7P7_9BACT|nr:glycerate kinase [Plebeiobacterium sediminum]MCW3788704.1 glycerate kinase [Plebeiobacterium sediminum]